MAISKQFSINYTHLHYGGVKFSIPKALSFNISKLIFMNSILAVITFVALLFYVFIMNYTASQSYNLYQLKSQLNQVNAQVADITDNNGENVNFAKLNSFARSNNMIKSIGNDVIFTNEDFAKF